MEIRSQQVGFFTAFLAHRVEFAVVGGVAVNAHGFVRNTRDLDVFFRPTPENAQAVFQALSELGAPLHEMDATDLLIDDAHYQLETEEGRIDLLSSIGEMRFDQVWRNRITVEIDGCAIPFISLEDLIENKRQVGRLIDLLDAEQLEDMRRRGR